MTSPNFPVSKSAFSLHELGFNGQICPPTSVQASPVAKPTSSSLRLRVAEFENAKGGTLFDLLGPHGELTLRPS